jgi:hypothetical protein
VGSEGFPFNPFQGLALKTVKLPNSIEERKRKFLQGFTNR